MNAAGYRPLDTFKNVMEQFLVRIGPIVPPAVKSRAARRLRAAEKALEKQDYVTAARGARDLLKLKQKFDEQNRAREMLGEIEAEGQNQFEAAQLLASEKKYSEATAGYSKVAKTFAGMEVAKDALKAINTLKNDPVLKKMLKEKEARSMWDEAQADEEAGRHREAIKLYSQLSSRYSSLELGRNARKKYLALMADPEIRKSLDLEKVTRQCRSWLSMGRNWARNDQKAKAKDYFQRIIDKYPDSTYAEQARAEIDNLK